MPDRSLDRRALLRRGGAVAAGLVGAGAVSSLALPGVADATQGQSVVAGTDNSATNTTGITCDNSTNPALALSTDDGTTAALRLSDHAYPDSDDPDANFIVGDLASRNGQLWYGLGDAVTALVLNDYITPITAALDAPVRVLDTRSQRGNVVNPSVLNSSGQLKAGQTMILYMDSEVELTAPSAVFANLTVAGATGAGFFTLWGQGARPNTSSLNFSKGQSLSNGLISSVGSANNRPIVHIYSTITTHLVLDLTGVTDYFDLGAAYAMGAGAAKQSPARAGGRQRVTPKLRQRNR